MSTGPSVSSISSKAALEQRRSSDAAFGSPRTQSDALTGTVVINRITGTPAWPPAQPSA